MNPKTNTILRSIQQYFQGFSSAMGAAWNHWWFTPRDAVSLSALRIAVGAITVYWLATLSPDLMFFFGENGLIPSDVVLPFAGPLDPGRLSYLHWLESPTELWIAHVGALVVGVLFAAGFFTRITSVLTLFVFLSYVHRAPMITGILEWVLAFVLFYLCFAPCGAHFSVDARRHQDDGAISSISANIVTRLLQLHTGVVYFMMGITMLSGPTQSWWFGEAVWYLIARPESRLVDLTWLSDHVYLINFWSHWIVFYELAFAILIWKRWARPLLLAAGLPHWLLLALISGQAPFCLTMLALNLPFLSPGRSHETEV